MLTDKTLYQKCFAVTEGMRVAELVTDMMATMREGNGIGLAANQIGDNRRVILVRAEGIKMTMINPEIIRSYGHITVFPESCLSFPGRKAFVPRHSQIEVSGFTEHWKPFRKKLYGLAARVVQHEVDHLDGITIFDREAEANKCGRI